LEKLGNKYGKDSPQYQLAQHMFNLDNERAEQTMKYQQSLMESQPKRYASATGKLAQEINEIENGIMPGTSTPSNQGSKLTPEQQDKLKGQYDLKQLKNITDTEVRKRILYSRNMEITLNNLNPEDLVTYSGPQGMAELLRDKAASLRGENIPRYENYKKALEAADLLSTQIRQFYGDSISPTNLKKLQNKVKPSGFLENPKVALERFNTTKKILNSEAETFRNAAVSADVYYKIPQAQHGTKNALNNYEERIVIIDSNGNEHTILKRNLSEAKKRDPALKIKGEINE
jgi:hypothetical protein